MTSKAFPYDVHGCGHLRGADHPPRRAGQWLAQPTAVRERPRCSHSATDL